MELLDLLSILESHFTGGVVGFVVDRLVGYFHLSTVSIFFYSTSSLTKRDH